MMPDRVPPLTRRIGLSIPTPQISDAGTPFEARYWLAESSLREGCHFQLSNRWLQSTEDNGATADQGAKGGRRSIDLVVVCAIRKCTQFLDEGAVPNALHKLHIPLLAL
jgi:hypothetical protein